MQNKLQHNLHIIKESFVHFFQAVNQQSQHNIPTILRYFFVGSEYFSYIIATLAIIFTFFLSTRYLYKFFLNKEKPVSDVLKVRLIIGHILNLSLTIILAGHIIRLIYSSNLNTIFFLVIVLLVRELLVYFLDKEVQVIYKNYNELLSSEKPLNVRQVGTPLNKKNVGSKLNHLLNEEEKFSNIF